MTTEVQARLEILRGRLEYQGGLLGILCALVTLILLVGSNITREPIAKRVMEDRLANLQQVLPETLYDNNPLATTLNITDAELGTPVMVYIGTLQGKLSAVAYEMKSAGYGGDMQLMLGVAADGKITGLRVVTHKETPGLADKIELDKSEWVLSFDGKSLTNTPAHNWAVKKDGGSFDQFTGATITPRAIVGSAYQYLRFFDRHKADIEQFANAHTAAAPTPAINGGQP